MVKSWAVNPRHRRGKRRRLDRLEMLGGPKRRAGLPAAVGRVTQDFQARLLVVEQLDAGRPVCGVRCGQRALGEQPRLRLGRDMGLVAVPPGRAGLAGMARLRVDGGDHPVAGDPPGDPEGPRPLASLPRSGYDRRIEHVFVVRRSPTRAGPAQRDWGKGLVMAATYTAARNDGMRGGTVEREEALEVALLQIEKRFGKGSVMRMGIDGPAAPVEAISTGSLGLDLALGIGGVPRGRVVEIFGPEASGKTTLGLHVIAEAQRTGGIAAFVDAEHVLDVAYARNLGVNTDELLISQPDTGEQALEIADMLIRSGALDVIVIDSVAALVPRAEIEGEMGDAHVGLQARLMSQALRKLSGALSTSGTTAIFINQLREKIGVMFGSPETTTGGKALKFYASIRLDIRRIETLKDGTDAVGNRTRVKVVKNKMAPPFKQAEFDIVYGQGISREGSLIDVGVEQGLVKKSGAWYTYENDQLGQGKENVRSFLRDNPDLADELEKKIKEKLGIGARVDEPVAPASVDLADDPIDAVPVDF